MNRRGPRGMGCLEGAALGYDQEKLPVTRKMDNWARTMSDYEFDGTCDTKSLGRYR
jgi:hypothetical protein